MKRVTKKERQLYELLELVSGLLSDPESYGMRAYWAMPGTEARETLAERIERTIEPYREFRNAEYEAELEREVD